MELAWQESSFAWNLKRCGFRQDTYEMLLGCYRTIARTPELRRLAQETYEALFAQTEVRPSTLPHVAPELGIESGLLHAVALLFRLPFLWKEHLRRGIPDSHTRATLEDLQRWLDAFAEAYGRPGLAESVWLSRHFQGRLVAVGRLQFELTWFDFPYRVFRHRGNGDAVIVAEPGVGCGPEGWPTRSAPLWESTLSEDRTGWKAHPVDANTSRLRRGTTLFPRVEWKSILAPGDRVLAVHIPKAGKLVSQAVADSFRDAAHHFPRWFPEHELKAITCVSWILDPQLRAYLPRDSNLLAFQRHFFPMPIPDATDEQIFERVLGGRRTLPPDECSATALQRAVLEHVRKGGTWRITGGVRLLKRGEASRHPFDGTIQPLNIE